MARSEGGAREWERNVRVESGTAVGMNGRKPCGVLRRAQALAFAWLACHMAPSPVNPSHLAWRLDRAIKDYFGARSVLAGQNANLRLPNEPQRTRGSTTVGQILIWRCINNGTNLWPALLLQPALELFLQRIIRLTGFYYHSDEIQNLSASVNTQAPRARGSNTRYLQFPAMALTKSA